MTVAKKLLFVIMMLPSIITTLYVLYRGLAIPENHISYDPLIFLFPCFLSFVAAVLCKQNYRITGLVISVINFAVVLIAVHFNFILQYDKWLKQKAPEKPFFIHF